MPTTKDARTSAADKLIAAAQLGAAAAGASAPEDFLVQALAQLSRLLDVPACAVRLRSERGWSYTAGFGLAAEPAATLAAQRLPDGFRSRWSVPLVLADGRRLGRLDCYGRERAVPTAATLKLARAYAELIALGLDRATQESGLAARYEAVVVALTSALEARDEYTGRHSTETSCLAEQVATRLGVAPSELELIRQVAVLHDVGKLGIPTDVLRKPGPLDRDEQVLMREHPVIGERILRGIPELGAVATAIRCEHERWDGGGYPDGLVGEQIPLASRIVFACDAWHAMTSDRPYRPAMARGEALAELRSGSGSQFDPRVARALLELLGDPGTPPGDSPREAHDSSLSRRLTELAAELAAEDLFVFRRVTAELFTHMAGVGRGAGWAGNIELDSRAECHFQTAIEDDRPLRLALTRPGVIFGPYHARSAIVVPCGSDGVVVFGSAGGALATASEALAARLAWRAHGLVVDVSPAKQLSDELEVLGAVRDVTAVNVESMAGTLTEIAARVRATLSAAFAAVATVGTTDADPVLGISAGGWTPADEHATSRALRCLAAAPNELPRLCQDVSGPGAVPAGFGAGDGVAAVYAVPIGTPAVAVMLIVHGDNGPRGFTDLCQRVAGAMADAAELVVRRALAQQRLRAANDQLRSGATPLRSARPNLVPSPISPTSVTSRSSRTSTTASRRSPIASSS